MIVKSVLACVGCLVFSEEQRCKECNNNVNKGGNKMKSVINECVEATRATTTLKDNVVELYREQCNCGVQIKHRNGGNYHAIHKLHLIGDENGVYCVVLERTTSRESFIGDKHVFLTFQDGEFRLESEEHTMEMYSIRFREGEAVIVYQNPQAFIETRKARAEELAETARAFGHDVTWEDFLMDV
jgi:hypothetical protein